MHNYFLILHIMCSKFILNIIKYEKFSWITPNFIRGTKFRFATTTAIAYIRCYLPFFWAHKIK